DGNRHAVQVVGYGKAGIITEASIDGGTGQYRGYRLDAIANSVLKPYEPSPVGGRGIVCVADFSKGSKP
ncbi:hypothetical protein MKK58_01530, partial [Methylobacterium sp. J-078]|uniref:hypothetical protein n=1 Tax=Methylobacterium sp. J-078 TaxID=2836657 RepID=UPI001FBA8103